MTIEHETRPEPQPEAPADMTGSVAIVAMGASFHDYAQGAAVMGGMHTVADEVWAVNAMAGVIRHDRAFIMDPPRYILDGETDSPAHRAYSRWLVEHPGPVYSVETDPRAPGVVEYPLEHVINSIGTAYLNTTVAYALAFAMAERVHEIKLFGCDFTYPDSHAAESGRGCVEYLIATALARGHKVSVCRSSTLMDANVPADSRLYAYTRAHRRPVITTGDNGLYKVDWVE